MNFREILGLLLAVVGLILFPVGWAFSRVLWLVAFALLFVGLSLFFSEKIRKREERLAKEAEGVSHHGRPMPSDVQDYTGWSKGGRSETMDDSFDSFTDDGD